ncbi:MAG: carboxypeptidase-like regulatory domain-containing protein [Chitinophagaceae bacterium]
MKLIHYSFLALFIGVSFIAQSQITISGKVVDSASKEALGGASVFAQNTTQGTVTDKEGNFSLPLKSGGYELIISFTGYKNQELRITDNKSQQVQIELVKEDKTLSEVIIQSSNEVMDGWEKYGDFFISHFIGATPFAKNCIIQNKDSVRFFYYRRSDKLKVLATTPLIISNDALGYDLRYQLDSFVYYYKTELSSYRGTCLFTEKLGTVSQAMVWKTNREKAYAGSRMQFMRAVYDSTLKQDGFNVDLLDENDKTKFARLVAPLGKKYYTATDSLDEVEIFYPRKISVTYTKATPSNEYLKQYGLPMDVGVQISYIDILNPIAIKQNGYYYDQKDWVNQGYWSWKNLADLLPYDYLP